MTIPHSVTTSGDGGYADAATRLFPIPVGAYDRDRQWAEITGEAEVGDTADLYGHCTRWCAIDVGRDTCSGAPVEEHGPFCESRSWMGVPGRVADDSESDVFVSTVAPYFHGRYRREDIREREALIRLAVDDGSERDPAVFLSIGDARRLLAGLQRAVDVADGLA